MTELRQSTIDAYLTEEVPRYNHSPVSLRNLAIWHEIILVAISAALNSVRGPSFPGAISFTSAPRTLTLGEEKILSITSTAAQ